MHVSFEGSNFEMSVISFHVNLGSLVACELIDSRLCWRLGQKMCQKRRRKNLSILVLQNVSDLPSG